MSDVISLNGSRVKQPDQPSHFIGLQDQLHLLLRLDNTACPHISHRSLPLVNVPILPKHKPRSGPAAARDT